MKEPSDQDLDALLSKGRMARPQREAVLREVLAKTTPQKKRFAWSWAFGFALSTAALVAVVVSLPREDDGFSAKGEQIVHAGIEAVCRDAGCKTVALTVSGVARAAFVSAYAVSPAGERAWLFAGASAAPLQAAPGTQVLAQSATLPTAGTWTFFVFVTEAPLSRDEMLKRADARQLKVEVAP